MCWRVGGEEPKKPQESLVLYKSFNTLCLEPNDVHGAVYGFVTEN